MIVLSIAYQGKELTRFRVTSPLILVGRSPLCDILLRAPGVSSVQFIFEWIGGGEFDPKTAHKDEWVMTEVGGLSGGDHERKANKSVVGQGAIFHEKPLRAGELVFSWIEDRLIEADLGKKIISQQVAELKGQQFSTSPKNLSSVLEVISINRDVDSVSDVYHYSFMRTGDWNTPVLSQFNTKAKVSTGVRGAQFSLPADAQSQLIRATGIQEDYDPSNLTIAMNDVLHVRWHQQEYYFRVVPKVFVPTVRRTIFSDPFYMILLFCVLIGVLGFYLIFRNVQNEKQMLVEPPRIAQIQVTEVLKVENPPPVPTAEPEVTKEEPLPVPKPEDVDPKKMVKTQPKDQTAVRELLTPTKNELMAKDSQKVKDAPKMVDKNKGSLDIPTEKSAINRTGFLSALRRTKNVGTVKADQVLDQGIITESVSGKSADFVLDQSASGIVNNQLRQSGDALAAASTKVNMKDRIGSGSLNVGKGDVLKEGYKANYGVSGEAGLIENNFGEKVGAQVEGGLDKDSVRLAIRAYKNDIRTCYEKALRVKSVIGGRIVYKFQINPDGTVVWINVQRSDVDSNSLTSCVQDVVSGIHFPVAKNGQKTIVIYPFEFSKKGSK